MADVIQDRQVEDARIDSAPPVVPGGPARELVPSEREVRLGVTRRRYEFSRPAAERPSRRRPVAVLRDLGNDLDPRTIGGPKLPVLLLGFSALFAQWDDQALAILLPEMRADFAFSLQFLLTLGSVLGVVSILLAPAMGYLADRVKRVWMVRLGAVLANAASVVQGLAAGIPQLVAGRAMAGLGQAVREPAGFPLLTDYYPSRSRARVFAFLGLMGVLGGIVGPSVAGNLGDVYGWRVAVVSLGILATLTTIGLFFLREPPRGYQDRLEAGASEEVARSEQPPVSWAEAWRAAGAIATVRRLWYATPFLQVVIVGMALFLDLYFAEEFGLSPRERGYLGTARGAFGLLGILVAAPLADRLLAYRPGRVMVALGGIMVLYAGLVLVLAVSNNLWVSVIVALPLGFGFVAISPALYTLLSLTIPARVRGLGMQTVAPWQLVGFAILPFLGRAADTWGVREGLMAFLPVYLIAALILATSSQGVDRDIRAARAASLADEEARRARSSGRAKMLVCRDVDVHYEGVQVLFNVDFDVDEGDMVALVGTNGAGKSTLLRAIAGVHEASNGAIFFDGHDVTHVPPHEAAGRGITLVPGGAGVFPGLTVDDNLRAAAWMFRDDRDYVRTETARVHKMFPVLAERRNQPAGALSGGEQQMLTLAQAFLSRPRLLMIDELSLGLAPGVVEQLLGTLREINAQGTTVVLVEQSLNTALRIARRAVFMEKGEIRFDGPTEELFRRPELVRSIFMGGGASATGRLGVSRNRSSKSGQVLLQASDVRLSFGGVRALNGASLQLAAGEVVGIIGPNGAGKTTLFDVISGFVRPETGSVSFEGKGIEGLEPDQRAALGLGRSFQDVRLFPSMTVRENLAVAREQRIASAAKNPVLAALWSPLVRESERKVFQQVDGLLQRFNLTGVADKFVNELSTGTRRAVDLACIALAEPKVLLLDEPSSGLAQAETKELGLLLARLSRELGCAMLVIEHDMSLIASLADRLVAMHLGQVIATGPPEEVLANRAVVSSYVDSQVGSGTGRGGDIESMVLGTLA